MSAIVVEAARIRDRKPTKVEISVSFQDTGRGLPMLFLFSDYSARLGDWKKRDEYRVEEIPTGMDGRAFLLHRSAAAIAAEGPDADEYYSVLVAHNEQDHQCECKGFQAHGRCKHHDAVRGLIEAGHLEDPRAGGSVPPVSNEEAPF